MNELFWTRLALNDVERIFRYIARDNLEASKKTIFKIEKSTESLAFHPFVGREGRKKGTRELVIVKKPYIVVYRLRENRVEILRVLHGAQRYSK